MDDSVEHPWQLGEPTVVYTTTWHSDVAYDGTSTGGGAAAWAGWDVAAWGLDGGGPLRKVGVVCTYYGPPCFALALFTYHGPLSEYSSASKLYLLRPSMLYAGYPALVTPLLYLRSRI